MNALVLGKNIDLSILVGIVKRHRENQITLISCTEGQMRILKRLGMKELEFRINSSVKHLEERIREDDVKKLIKIILSWGVESIYLSGEINHSWIISIVKSEKYFATWDKSSIVNIENLCLFAEVSQKEVPEEKRVGEREQVFFQDKRLHNFARFFPTVQLVVVKAIDFPKSMNFLALGLKEGLFERVLVTCLGEVPVFAHEWAKCLPSTLVSGGGFGNIVLGESGFEEVWNTKLFSRIQVISEEELSAFI